MVGFYIDSGEPYNFITEGNLFEQLLKEEPMPQSVCNSFSFRQ